MMQEIHDRNHVDEQGDTRALNKDIRRQEYDQKSNVTLNALFGTAKQSAENNLREQTQLHPRVMALESVEAKGEHQSSFFDNQSIALKSGPIEYEGGLSPAERARMALDESSAIDPTQGDREVNVRLQREMTDRITMSAGMTIEGETEGVNNAGEYNVIKMCNNIYKFSNFIVIENFNLYIVINRYHAHE
jgi:hypothetical protein